MVAVDYLVVGAGLTGAVIARQLQDAGREVLVLDRRPHAGGNVHDHTHPSGIRVHTYGPHYFRTERDDLWDFVRRFDSFYRYEAVVKTLVDGRYENWPPTASSLQRLTGGDWGTSFTGTPSNFEEASLAMMPRLLYEKFVKGYTEKQWGVEARRLSASLARRFELRHGDDPRLMRHKHQGLPAGGYAHWMNSMLAGIPLLLNTDYLRYRRRFRARRCLIFTGPVDEYFGFELGRLTWRGQRRDHLYIAGAGFEQPVGQVNNPAPHNGAHIRSLEWKHMMPREFAGAIQGTVLTRETPFSPENPEEYEYPFPDEGNARLYEAYRTRAAALDRVLICGRLGEYRYYDMDHAIARAMVLVRKLLQNWPQSRAA